MSLKALSPLLLYGPNLPPRGLQTSLSQSRSIELPIPSSFLRSTFKAPQQYPHTHDLTKLVKPSLQWSLVIKNQTTFIIPRHSYRKAKMAIAMLQSLKCYVQKDSHKLAATFSFPTAAPEMVPTDSSQNTQ